MPLVDAAIAKPDAAIVPKPVPPQQVKHPPIDAGVRGVPTDRTIRHKGSAPQPQTPYDPYKDR
jgi:hypothetical protein